ncbi:hypothetical protein A0J61_06771 [Choanephora cucurbitarum]|uniref:Uncharacterized protein n=1 Tax=Choanephora cucurbitarum TaxID=101091 RepID=A0A1C7N976_9FUNG|nr:hypothetical protein A0J61_06771 [Choanephora cucurbitarum]
MKQTTNPLSLTRIDSEAIENEAPTYLQKTNTQRSMETTSKSVIEASQTILFTASTLQRTITRCINCIGNDSLHAAFSPILQKSKLSTEKLLSLLDLVEKRPELCQDLIQITKHCILILKELCWTLRTRLSTVVQGLDAKFSRNLLMNLYSATVDMKDAWLVIQPFLSVDSSTTLLSFKSMSRQLSQSETQSLQSPSQSLADADHQLYTHLRSAISNSLHVLTTLRQSIDETLQTPIASSLKEKLTELSRQAQYTIELSHQLDKSIEANMASSKEESLLALPPNECLRQIWGDTSIHLKAIVNVMTFIRSISKEEEFSWPKSIKQGCLYMTRMTAEVAKLWNSHSTFAENGLFLGRYERSSSVSSVDQYASSPAATATTHTAPNDIPIQHRAKQ